MIADTPPLACLAATRAGVPAIVAGNFTWDWIYAGYPDHLHRAPTLLATLESAYAAADGAWRFPMWGGFDTVDPIVDVPFVARHARHAASDVRRTLGLPLDRPLALLSFGGYGLASLAPRSLDLGDCVLVTIGSHRHDPRLAARPASVYSVDESQVYDAGYRYEDVVAAVDIVLSKPGYGIISECIANDTALVYTSRGNFAEYHHLVDEMPRWLRCEFIGHDDLFAGRWAPSLRRVLAKTPRARRPRTDGADVIAELLLARL